MFENLTDKLQSVLNALSGRGKLSDADVSDALRDIRIALLEADVHFKVVKEFLVRVRERAVGHEVSRALNPGQQVLKIVHDELVTTLGQPESLHTGGQGPAILMLVGLQGSGKTTTAAKLARRLRSEGHEPLLVAADPHREAGVHQLQDLGSQVDVPVFVGKEEVPALCSQSLEYAESRGHKIVIFDTAGRLHLDEEMMLELSSIRDITKAHEVLLVADAMTGQEAVHIASGFHDQVGLTGLIMTKMDGDARGGAAISMRAVTGLSIKFLGTSERLDGIELFDPARLANRILGMGDMIGLIERAEAVYDNQQAETLEAKMRTAEFDLEDFLSQMGKIKSMGPAGQLLDMLPGVQKSTSQLSSQQVDNQLLRVEAIISSMTPHERHNPRMMNASRKRRVAAGSGTQVQEVNRLLKQFRQMQDMMKSIGKRGKGRSKSGRLMVEGFGM